MLLEIIKWCLQPLPILIFILYYCLYKYFTSTFDYWLVRNVPFRKPTVILGNFGPLLLFRKSQPEGIQDMYNWFKDERFFGVFRVKSPILILRDPELVKSVCVKDFSYFMNRGIVNNPQDPLAGHLFNLEGQHWKNLRSKLTPAFSSGKLKKMFYLLAECSKELERLIGQQSTSSIIEVRELTAHFTIDVIGTCAFGIQINALTDQDSAFRKAASKLSKPSYKAALWRMLRTAVPRLYKILGVQVIDPSVTRFFQDIVSQMIKERENNNVKRHDFMDLLIELKNKGSLETEIKDGDQSPDDEKKTNGILIDETSVAAQAFVFFVAGYETSSNTIAFCLYELALNPEIQEMTRQNVTDALKKHDEELTYEAVQEMTYLDKVILETLRKYPPAPMLSRKCEYTYRIPKSDVELSKGIRVVIPIYAIHHDSNHYPNPTVFDPQRFHEDVKRTRHPYTFLPFGEGPRNCIGMRFALLQIKVGIISFLRHHRVEICDETAIPITFSRRSLVTSSEKGIRLKITFLSN